MAHATTVELLERERELRDLDRAVEEARSGRGRLVLVEGPPGIGKTRLLEAARRRAGEEGMCVLSARASELDREFPFGVLRQLFEPLLAGADAARRGQLLRGAAGPAASLLGQGRAEGAAATRGGDSLLTRFHALYWLAANLAEEAPLALAIDDVQWADAASLRFLEFLVPRLDGLPVLVALAARPSRPDADREPIDAIATDALAEVLRPAALSEAAAATLIATETGDEPDPLFADACHQATGGNPFLLRELLHELAVEEVPATAAGVPVVRQLAPPTVARAVLLRLARLGDEASRLARAIAVLGDGTPLRQAAALADLAPEPAAETAATLAHAGILADGRPASFAHPVLRSVVYADIDTAERASAHRRAAALLSSEGAAADAVALHLLATEPAEDPYVVATLREAAEHALERGAADTAVACLRRALAEPPERAERGPLIVELASAELNAGDPGGAVDHFEEAQRLTDEPLSRARFVLQQSVALQAAGRHDDAYALRERTAEEVAGSDPELAMRIEMSIVATASLDLSRLDWARERLERHRGPAWTEAPGPVATRSYVEAMYDHGGRGAEALAVEAERALASGGLFDEVSAAPTTPFFSAIEVLCLADRAGPARRALDRAIEAARRRGSALAFACASGWRCLVLAREGALADAEADARSCAELALPQGWFDLAPPMLGYVLEVLIDRGALDDAERLLDRSGMAGRPVGEDLSLYPMFHARARLRGARGDLAGGRADMAGLLRARARWNTHPTLVPPVLAAPELASTDPDAARAQAERMLSDAHAWGTPRAIGMALRAAGLVEGGAGGLELLGEAATVLEGSPAPLEHGRALADLGAALRRANHRADARDPLRRALDLADSCGAAPLAERARHELRAAGGRPRRPRTTGAEALTASERRVAALAAEGLSNPEIAQALFVTKKTVEAHLSSAYRKLDIESRRQLGAALSEG